jgi:hypothetical protein
MTENDEMIQHNDGELVQRKKKAKKENQTNVFIASGHGAGPPIELRI